MLGAVNDAYLAYWHLGRLGILTYAPQEFIAQNSKEGREAAASLVRRNASWLSSLLGANPGAVRPLIDLHHIELFLVWLIFWQADSHDEIYKWFSVLENYLLTRRMGRGGVPFIESRNRMDLVAEYAATSVRPAEFTDSSSYLLLMILELCFSLEESRRDELLDRYYRQIVKGLDNEEKPMDDKEIDLLGWHPPDDWEKRILKESVTDGIAITTNNFETYPNDDRPLAERIKTFVKQCREKFPPKVSLEVPRAALILGCLKNKSPLPPEFWRGTIFNQTEEINDNE